VVTDGRKYHVGYTLRTRLGFLVVGGKEEVKSCGWILVSSGRGGTWSSSTEGTRIGFLLVVLRAPSGSSFLAFSVSLSARPPAIAEILKPILSPPPCFSPPIVLCVGMKTLLTGFAIFGSPFDARRVREWRNLDLVRCFLAHNKVYGAALVYVLWV